jgi:uncharacterized protein YecT (DUF1311 family)
MLIAGLSLIVVGLVGGGIEVKELKLPQISMLPRAASFLVGCILTALALFDQKLLSPPQPDLPAASTQTPAQPAVAAASTQTTPCEIRPNQKPRPSPGVNCNASGTPDEIQICASASLCDLDWKLFSIYHELKSRLDENQQSKLLISETEWVKERGECQGDVACIAAKYQSRIDILAEGRF